MQPNLDNNEIGVNSATSGSTDVTHGFDEKPEMITDKRQNIRDNDLRFIPASVFGLEAQYRTSAYLIGKSVGYAASVFETDVDLGNFENCISKMTEFMETVKSDHFADGKEFDYLLIVGVDIYWMHKISFQRTGRVIHPVGKGPATNSKPQFDAEESDVGKSVTHRGGQDQSPPEQVEETTKERANETLLRNDRLAQESDVNEEPMMGLIVRCDSLTISQLPCNPDGPGSNDQGPSNEDLASKLLGREISDAEVRAFGVRSALCDRSCSTLHSKRGINRGICNTDGCYHLDSTCKARGGVVCDNHQHFVDCRYEDPFVYAKRKRSPGVDHGLYYYLLKKKRLKSLSNNQR